MKKIILIMGLMMLMMITGCCQIAGKKEADGSITFEPGEFQAWTEGYEDGVKIRIESLE